MRMNVNILGYADDIAILICGKFLNTVSELLQEALWYNSGVIGLSCLSIHKR